MAGNSSGGWIALELGRLHRARTVTGLSPAGLWRRTAPRHIRPGHASGPAQRPPDQAARSARPAQPAARGMAMIQASGRPFHRPYEPIRTAVHDMAAAPGFRETLRARERSRFEDGAAITVPVTIAFGSRDRVLLPGVARRRDQLPDHTRWVTLAGCGHVPMFDDPQAVTDLLLAATHPDTAGELGKPIRGR